jgi:hypothetical protein
MSSYFSKTRLLIHPFATNPPMPKLSPESMTMTGNIGIYTNNKNEGKLSTLLKLASDVAPLENENMPPIGFGMNSSLSLGDLNSIYFTQTTTNTLHSPREALKKLKLSPSYIDPNKKLDKIKLDDFIG